MRTAAEVYAAYNVMPSLQLHQLRVAAVGKLIVDNFKEPVSKEDVILACLFHDMGNIVKSDLSRFPEFCEPEGLSYWEDVKADFIRRYGSHAHEANIAIGKELQLLENVVAIMDASSFSRLENVLASDSVELKILQYADTRVGPYGVLSIGERLVEARKRYVARIKTKEYYETDENFEKLSKAAYGIEKQILALTTIGPDDINEAAVTPLLEQLRKYPVA